MAVVLSDMTKLIGQSLVVTPITGLEHRRGGYPFDVPILRSDYPELDKDSLVKTDQVLCLDKADLIDGHYAFTLRAPAMLAIYKALVGTMNFRVGLGQAK